MNSDQQAKDQLAFAVIKAARDTMGVNIDTATVARISSQMTPGASTQAQVPGFYSRFKQAAQYVVSGVGPSNWFGPWQPLRPLADVPEQGVIGRQFDYAVGQNLRIPPRAEEAITFSTLRGLAEEYDLLRLAIETCKDQIESFEWEIIPKNDKADPSAFKDDIKTATDFFQYPDHDHNWNQWLRMLVEDMLVLDAVCIFPQQTRGGGLYSLDLIDGATIKRVIDEYGRTPAPPNPAYQQVLKGVPAVDYTRDQLRYIVRNPRTWKLYGYSPVEQIIMTVNIAMRRQISQLQFYTEGNVPEALVSTPETWNAEMVKDFQNWWDQMMVGSTAEKRRMKFVPNLGDGKIIFPKEAVLKDEYDEWLARIICFSLSLPPTALIKQMNRASSEQIAETARMEGQMPRMRFIASQINYLIATYLKLPNVVFSWKTDVAMDPLKKAQASEIYVNAKVITPDEVRADDLGKAPITESQRETAWPAPPPAPNPFAPQTGTPPFGGKSKTEGFPDKGGAVPPAFKIDVHPPEIHLGDTFVRVMPSDGGTLTKVTRLPSTTT